MTQKYIRTLVKQSYTANMLDEKKVEEISAGLSHKDLRMFIRLLKKQEKARRVRVAVPVASVYNQDVNKVLLEVFPNKEIVIEEDALLLLGAKVTANDMVYEISVRSRLEMFLDSVDELYD